jgi:hypothetical protein
MESAAKVYAGLAESTSRLHELDVTPDVLRDAVRWGMGYAFECTQYDPASLPGTLAWGRTVRGLRERLVPQGWKPDNERNYPTVIHQDQMHAIGTASGDAHTGRADRTPATRTEKGPATRKAIAETQRSFWEVAKEFPRPRVGAGMQTWLLLYYFDELAQEIRAELSLPAEMDDNGYVRKWRERVILPSIPVEREPMVMDDAPAEPIEVKVERRAN